MRKCNKSGAIIFDQTTEEKELSSVKSELDTIKEELAEMRKLFNATANKK